MKKAFFAEIKNFNVPFFYCNLPSQSTLIAMCKETKMTGATISGKALTDRITEIIRVNLTNDKFGVSELAREIGISRSNLHRKVKKEARCSVSQFICRVRLQKALEILRNTSLPISETAFDCGFHSVAYFSKCFHDYYGFSPGQTKIPVARPNQE